MGSRHAAVEYAVPHHFHHHHHHGAAYVEYHQGQLSFSDDDSSSEPGYATGIWRGLARAVKKATGRGRRMGCGGVLEEEVLGLVGCAD